MLETSQKRNRAERGVLRNEVRKAEGAWSEVTAELRRCVDAVAKGGLDVLGDELTSRAKELRARQQQLAVELEKKRQESAVCDAAAFDEQRVRESIAQLGTLLPRLEPAERKELVRHFVERVEIRLAQSLARSNFSNMGIGADPSRRFLTLRIKLRLPQLVQGVEAKQGAGPGIRRMVAMPALSFETRMDFSHAMSGEVTIVAPFHQPLGTNTQSRESRAREPRVEHAILKAQRWQRLIDAGKIANQFALSKRLGLDSGGVTRVMKLVKLMPEIQEFLAALKTKHELRHFGMKSSGRVGSTTAGRPTRCFRQAKTQLLAPA